MYIISHFCAKVIIIVINILIIVINILIIVLSISISTNKSSQFCLHERACDLQEVVKLLPAHADILELPELTTLGVLLPVFID